MFAPHKLKFSSRPPCLFLSQVMCEVPSNNEYYVDDSEPPPKVVVKYLDVIDGDKYMDVIDGDEYLNVIEGGIAAMAINSKDGATGWMRGIHPPTS